MPADTELLDTVLRNINSATRNIKLYPKGHPAVATQIRKAFNDIENLLKERRKVFIGRLKDVLVFNEAPIMDVEEKIGDLLLHMEKKEIEGIIFESGTTQKEFATFIDILLEDDNTKGTALNNKLYENSVKYITIKSIPLGKKTLTEVYMGALDVVKDVINDLRLGKVPKSDGVKETVVEISEAVLNHKNTMIGLTLIKNYDEYLYNHSVNVSILASALSQHMGYERNEIIMTGIGGLLHDIGKTGVSENIIKKPGSLSNEEWESIKEHPVHGSKIIEKMKGIERLIGRLVYEHHMGYNLSGYPKGETSLHPLSMIITISDAYDALTTMRVYQRPYHPIEAIKILSGLSGKHFAPEVMNAFINMLGVYPLGTMVRLSSNEIAIVTGVNPSEAEYPSVKVIIGPGGERIAPPFELNLLEEKENGRFIVSPVDPLARDTDVGEFFKEEGSAQEI